MRMRSTSRYSLMNSRSKILPKAINLSKTKLKLGLTGKNIASICMLIIEEIQQGFLVQVDTPEVPFYS